MGDRLPSLNGLRVVEAVARHLSVTRAAEELHVTPSAVSHQVGRVEKDLGIRLFVRRSHALSLTDDGAQYLARVGHAFRELADATSRLPGRGRGPVLVVSTLASLAAKWLLPRLEGFRAGHGEVDLRVVTGTGLTTFGRDGVDVAIRYGAGTWDALRADWLMADALFPVCSPALCRGGALRTPGDLAQHTLLRTSGVTGTDWDDWLTAAGLARSALRGPALTFDLNLVTIQAAIDGLGVAIGRTAYVEADLRAGRLVAPFAATVPARAGFYVVSPRETADRPVVRAFRTWLLAAAAMGAPSRP